MYIRSHRRRSGANRFCHALEDRLFFSRLKYYFVDLFPQVTENELLF